VLHTNIYGVNPHVPAVIKGGLASQAIAAAAKALAKAQNSHSSSSGTSKGPLPTVAGMCCLLSAVG
jgi:hypothetical protein